MARKADEAVVTALPHDLLRAGVTLHCTAIVEHFVACLDEEQVARRRDPRHIQAPPLPEMGLGELVRLASVKVLLWAQVRTQPDLRIDRWVDEHRPGAVLLGEVGRIEPPERRADKARILTSNLGLDDANRVGCERR